ncbi:MAG: transcriptional repressor LexA [Gammaproteobacteria bacterium]
MLLDKNALTRRQREIFSHLAERAAAGEPPPTLDELCSLAGLRSRGSMHKHVQALIDAGLVMPMEGKRRGVRIRHEVLDGPGGPAGLGETVRSDESCWAGRGPGNGAGPEYGPVRHGAEAVDPDADRELPDPNLTLPWLGRIAAGRPIEAIEQAQSISVPPGLLPGVSSHASGKPDRDYYVLEVQGDSMCEDGILDGDWVVVEHRELARNGEIVVALVDEAEATLKRIEQQPDRCVLHPCNANYAPMVFEPSRVRVQGVVVAQMRKYT